MEQSRKLFSSFELLNYDYDAVGCKELELHKSINFVNPNLSLSSLSSFFLLKNPSSSSKSNHSSLHHRFFTSHLLSFTFDNCHNNKRFDPHQPPRNIPRSHQNLNLIVCKSTAGTTHLSSKISLTQITYLIDNLDMEREAAASEPELFYATNCHLSFYPTQLSLSSINCLKAKVYTWSV